MKEKLEQIKAILRRAISLSEAATIGPWTGSQRDNEPHTIAVYNSDRCIADVTGHIPDASLITHARTFAPAAAMSLLIAIETLESVDQCEGIAAFKAEKALQEIINQFEE